MESRAEFRRQASQNVPMGPGKMSPTADGLVLAFWLQRLHVRTLEPRKPQQVESTHVTLSTATSTARVESSTTSPACVRVILLMRLGTMRNPRFEHLVNQ